MAGEPAQHAHPAVRGVHELRSFTAREPTPKLASHWCCSGRWNHNSRRVAALAELLVAKGFAVQLEHVEAEAEESRDTVEVLKGEQVLARHEDYQHNRNFRQLGDNAEKMLATVVEAGGKDAPAPA